MNQKIRCSWVNLENQLYVEYHDLEWGRPTTNPHLLFEKICLEGFQSGLSWLTILKKRKRFREVFANFNFYKVAEFGETDVQNLLQDAGIIRHRQKIEATINNANQAIKLTETYGSLTDWFWQWALEQPNQSNEIPSQTKRSKKLAQELKKLDWKFVGATTAYAFMQSEGLVNDHTPDCYVYKNCEAERQQFLQGRNLRDEA